MSEEDSDLILARKLQKQFDDEVESSNSDSYDEEFNSRFRSNSNTNNLHHIKNLVHPQWETLDPTPDILVLFQTFNSKFFQKRLDCVTIEWSKRMYSCAGICYSKRNRFGMDVTIRLSEPLLKLRPRKDLVETMLHEMIHAYCFVLNIREGNGGHGPNFKKIMYAINKVAGTNITVYHTFYDEVNNYKQHWWRCNGICTNRAPFFGYVKRSTNRKPGYYDQWWQAHQEACGGTFMKIRGPEVKKNTNEGKNKENKTKKTSSSNDLRKYFSTNSDKNNKANTNSTSLGSDNFKGIKSDGDGTTVLEPKTKSSSIANAFPPTSYPGLSSNPFNSGTIRTLQSLLENEQTNSRQNFTPKIKLVGKGYKLGSSNDKKSPTSNSGKVDREHLRNLWVKRFSGNQNSTVVNNIPIDVDSNVNAKRHNDDADKPVDVDEHNDITSSDDTTKNTAKRRRISKNSNKKFDWIIVDDEVMMKEQDIEIITLDDSESESEATPSQKTIKKNLTGEERLNAIKQEILNESQDLTREDIIVIDDEYNDDENSNELIAAGELADTSVIDEFFGEDTLLQEFKNENDVVPTFSRHIPNPDDDIIKCPICQSRMKRCVFGDHLDGCTGIAIRVEPPTGIILERIVKKKYNKPRNTQHKKSKTILLSAGYTEEDLENLEDISSNDEDDSLNSTSPQRNISINSSTPSPIDENSKLYRQRNLYKTTIQCPACGIEVEKDEMSDHLDECDEIHNKIKN